MTVKCMPSAIRGARARDARGSRRRQIFARPPAHFTGGVTRRSFRGPALRSAAPDCRRDGGVRRQAVRRPLDLATVIRNQAPSDGS